MYVCITVLWLAADTWGKQVDIFQNRDIRRKNTFVFFGLFCEYNGKLYKSLKDMLCSVPKASLPYYSKCHFYQGTYICSSSSSCVYGPPSWQSLGVKATVDGPLTNGPYKCIFSTWVSLLRFRFFFSAFAHKQCKRSQSNKGAKQRERKKSCKREFFYR
jgi:hypothetical protein